eukprot:Em0003g1422a
MLHPHVLGFVVTMTLLQNAVDSSNTSTVITYINQTNVNLHCACTVNCRVDNWTLNGTSIQFSGSGYSVSGSYLDLNILRVRLADEGLFLCNGNGFVCNFSLVVLGTLQFVSSPSNSMSPVLDTAVILLNAGPSQQVAPTSFTLSAQGSSPPCCNQSAVLEPLPFFVTNTTYKLLNYNCPNVMCTYVATLQAAPLMFVTPSAMFKTFIVTITPTGTILQPTSTSISQVLYIEVGVPIGGIIILLLVTALLVVICIRTHKRRPTSSSVRKRDSFVEQDLDMAVELNVISKADNDEKNV